MLQNVRLGFATNSSSSHSIVFATDVEPGSAGPTFNFAYSKDAFDFGWEGFELSTPDEKLAYLAVVVNMSLSQTTMSTAMANAVLSQLFAGTGVINALSALHDGYIDHQSAFTIPHSNLEVLERRVKDYIDVFCDPRITIHGGNDNADVDEDDYPYHGGPTDQIMGFGEEGVASIRARKDDDAIVLFNVNTGAKIRYASTPYVKSTVPELVDLKITDACPYGCEFCCQGSTRNGAVAEYYNIRNILQICAELGTFEIAIGGGEPTTHPNFADIVRCTHELGMVPNFTTYAVDWLLEPKIVEAVKLCGGIGVSVHNASDLNKVRKIKKAFPDKRVVAQHVFGTLPADKLWHLLMDTKRGETAIPVLLLGYKTTGRGTSNLCCDMQGFTKEGDYYRNWLPELSVDTAFAAEHQDVLDWIGVDKVLVTAEEGKFSMYIDAVAKQAGPSSYCTPAEMVDFPKNKWGTSAADTEWLKNTFAKF